MDPALSDLLICPRCGPSYGLVLLPVERRDRTVVRGTLGCANCRERYAVVREIADLRVGSGPGEDSDAGVAESIWAGTGEDALRLAGLLGLAEARGTVVLAGPAAAVAGELAELSADVTIVAVPGAGTPASPGPAVSVVRASAVLPLRSGSVAAVALTGAYAELVGEGSRLLAPGARILVEPAPEEALAAGSGLEVVAREREAVVAVRR